MSILLSLLLSGCCRNEVAPILDTPRIRTTDENSAWTVSLEDIVLDSSLELNELTVTLEVSNPDVTATLEDGWITITPSEFPFNGSTTLSITVQDACEVYSIEEFDVTFGTGDVPEGSCPYTFSYVAPENTSAVFVAGEFNDWNTTSHPMTEEDGVWTTQVILESESAYKFVVEQNGSTDWTCDPTGEWFQCDAGQPFINTCELNDGSCNSIATLDCEDDALSIATWSHNDSTATVELSGSEGYAELELVYNGITSTVEPSVQIEVALESTDRHTIRLTGIKADGDRSESIHLPFWTDDFEWNRAVMYFPFVDRFENGDTSNDKEYGTNWHTGDYLGGDWQGIINKLDYLDNMGVTALWINSPLNNPDGTYEGDCGMTITGYHGYWPESNSLLEEHFGDEDTLRQLIQGAHDRGIRVLIDWVGNHVHEEHPWYVDHKDWFTNEHLCRENDNGNQAPETCWFAPYVPTFDYSKSPVMVRSIDDAIDFAIEYNIDGFRVDAVKHMPKAVHWNFERQIQQRIEHSSDTPFDFYTVGETFSGDRGLLGDYIGDEYLDGQFDFALYWKLLDTFAHGNGSLVDLELESQASLAAFSGNVMSNFLGNHDVERFINHAAGEVSSIYGEGLCGGGDWRVDAQNPDWDEPYNKLKLAWTWLLTHPGASLIYYGDEIGLPGYHDPDNRQMMQWDWNSRQAGVQSVVEVLSNARQNYPQITSENRTLWWEDYNSTGVIISENDQHALVLLNRGSDSVTVSNSVSWAGIPASGTVENILTGQTFSIDNDQLTYTLAGWESAVLIFR